MQKRAAHLIQCAQLAKYGTPAHIDQLAHAISAKMTCKPYTQIIVSAGALAPDGASGRLAFRSCSTKDCRAAQCGFHSPCPPVAVLPSPKTTWNEHICCGTFGRRRVLSCSNLILHTICMLDARKFSHPPVVRFCRKASTWVCVLVRMCMRICVFTSIACLFIGISSGKPPSIQLNANSKCKQKKVFRLCFQGIWHFSHV